MKSLLHFTAPWCQPCKKMEPIIEELIDENSDVSYQKFDISENMEYTVDYNVSGIPTFIAMVDGVEVSRHTGVATKEKMLDLFN